MHTCVHHLDPYFWQCIYNVGSCQFADSILPKKRKWKWLVQYYCSKSPRLHEMWNLRCCLWLCCLVVLNFKLRLYIHIYFLPFWMKRIHCNTKQTLWLNGRNNLKTLLSPNQIEIASWTSMCFMFPVSWPVFSHTSSSLICPVTGENLRN